MSADPGRAAVGPAFADRFLFEPSTPGVAARGYGKVYYPGMP
ncbi:hypothetical protein Q5530_23945 [Saccharothrix sp. BKS2]